MPPTSELFGIADCWSWADALANPNASAQLIMAKDWSAKGKTNYDTTVRIKKSTLTEHTSSNAAGDLFLHIW